MHALLLDGSREGDTAAEGPCRALKDELAQRGYQAETLALRSMQIAGCLGCFGCWVRTPGVCVIDDAGREVARRAVGCDLLVFFTRVTFGGYSSELKKAVDRLIPNISPFFMKVRGEVHHRMRYGGSPCLLAVGMAAGPDAEAEGIFRKLAERNAINGRNAAHAAVFVYDGQPTDDARADIGEALDGMEAGT